MCGWRRPAPAASSAHKIGMTLRPSDRPAWPGGEVARPWSLSTPRARLRAVKISPRRKPSALAALALVSLVSMLASAPLIGAEASDQSRSSAADVDWAHYAADNASSKYSPAAQIDASNVAKLAVAWRW